MTPLQVLAALRKRADEFAALRRAAEIEFVYTGDDRHVIRRDVVARAVARQLRCDVSQALQADLIVCMERAGWKRYRLRNRRLWRGVRARDVTDEQAVAHWVAEKEAIMNPVVE